MLSRLALCLASTALFTAACATDGSRAVDGAAPDAPPPLAEVFEARASTLSQLFPKPKASVEIGASAGTLAELAARVSSATGVVFSSQGPVTLALRESVVALSQPVSISADELYPWFEGLLAQHHFALAVQAGTHPTLVEIISVAGPSSIRTPALAVPLDELEFARRHPALLITTTMRLEHCDARTVGNSMRAHTMVDPLCSVTPIVTPVATSDSLVLSGQARVVVALVDILREVESAAAKGADAGKLLREEFEKSRAR